MVYPHINAVEDELLERLKADQRLIDWRAEIKAVPTLEGGQRNYRLFNTFPGVGTFARGATYEGLFEKAPLFVFTAGQNFRKPGLARVGGANEPGAQEVLECCRQVVKAWNTLGTNLQSLEPVRWFTPWANAKAAVCILEILVEITRPEGLSDEEARIYGSTYP